MAADESSGDLTQNYMNKKAGASLRLFPVVPNSKFLLLGERPEEG